jgi:collagen type I alpha
MSPSGRRRGLPVARLSPGVRGPAGCRRRADVRRRWRALALALAGVLGALGRGPLLPAPVRAAASIARVQSGTAATASSSSSLSVTMTSPSTAGTLLVVTLSGGGTFTTAASGWVQAKAQAGAANSQGAAIWYYSDNPGGVSSVTFTSTVVTAWAGEMSEWSGVAPSLPLDATNASTSATAARTYTLNVSPSASNDLVITDYSWFRSGGGFTWTRGTGWTNLSQAAPGNYGFAADDDLSLAAGAQSEAVSTGTTGTWDAVAAAFRPNGAIAQVQAGTYVAGTTGTTLTVTLPAASTAGTMLVVQAANALSSAASFTAPAGWSRAVTLSQSGNGTLETWYYPNNPGGITSATFTVGTSTEVFGCMTEWSGVATVSPLDQTGTKLTATSVSSDTVTTSGATAVGGELGLTEFTETGAATAYTAGAGWSHVIADATNDLVADADTALAAGVASETESFGASVNPDAAVIATFRPDVYGITDVTAAAGTSPIGGGSLSGTLPAATWSDTTAGGSTWHGTVAVTLFNDTGTWARTQGSDTLAVTTSGVYTGSAGQAYYVVSVTADTGTAVTASVSGSETGTIAGGAHGSPLAVGTKGVTIQFRTGTTYAPGDQFTIHVGNLPASAMSLSTATGSVTVLSGSETASLENNGMTVSGGTPTAVGSAVAFVTAGGSSASGGSFRIVPGATTAYDPNNVWAAAYVATVSYTMVSGP